MEKIWIKKELYILRYEFLKFYLIFPIFIWFLIEFFKFFLVRKNREKGKTYLRSWRGTRRLTWQASPDGAHVATGPGGADVASEPTWRAGPPRRYDVALRPRGRTRVARASRKAATRPRGRPCGAPRVAEQRGDIMIVNRGMFSPI